MRKAIWLSIFLIFFYLFIFKTLTGVNFFLADQTVITSAVKEKLQR